MLIGFEVKNPETGQKERFTLPEAIENAHKIGLPVMILAGIIKSIQDRGAGISATALTGCMRRTFWERTKDYYADPTDLLYKAFRGSMIHAILESVASDKVQIGNSYGTEIELAINRTLSRYIPETRFYREVNGFGIQASGQIDLLEMLDNGAMGRGLSSRKPKVIIHDYKTAEPYAIKLIGQKGLSEEHEFQTNFYSWLVSPHFNVVGLKIHYIGFGFCASTGSICVVKEFGRPTEVALPEASLWPEAKFLALAEPKIKILVDSFKLNGTPAGDPGDNGWRCKSCPFADSCDNRIISVKTKKLNGKEKDHAENQCELVGNGSK